MTRGGCNTENGYDEEGIMMKIGLCIEVGWLQARDLVLVERTRKQKQQT